MHLKETVPKQLRFFAAFLQLYALFFFIVSLFWEKIILSRLVNFQMEELIFRFWPLVSFFVLVAIL